MTSRNPLAFLQNAARNSPWLVIAAALHLIVIAGAAIFYTSSREAPVEDRGIEIGRAQPKVTPEDLPAPVEDTRRDMPTNQPQELVDFQNTWVPIDTSADPTPFGDPDSTLDRPSTEPSSSTAIGVGQGGVRAWRPSPFSRPGTGLLSRGSPTGGGGPPKSLQDAAVLDGMRWLARHQNVDGSWGALSLRDHCDADHPCADPKTIFTTHYDEGLTALALLTFLGAGFSHETEAFLIDPVTGKKYVLGTIVKSGLKWLTEHQNPDGSFGKDRPFMYCQALATMALCEAYGLTQNRYWHEPAQKAVDYLQAAQRPNPSGQGQWGWRYVGRQEVERFHQGDSVDEQFKRELYDADTSVTGWCVMALKSARMAGLDVQQPALDGGLAFAKWVTADNGLVGYIDPKGAGATVTGPNDHFIYHPAGMSALGMCIRTFTAHDENDPFLDLAAKQVVKDLPQVSKDRLSVDYYYWYYGSLAINQLDGPDSPKKGGGRYWGMWNKAMIDALLSLQDKSPKSCNQGGWLVGDRWSYSGGPVYATAINVLTLEVAYRYPNAFGTASARVPAQKK
jgi:hypothetical protein